MTSSHYAWPANQTQKTTAMTLSFLQRRDPQSARLMTSSRSIIYSTLFHCSICATTITAGFDSDSLMVSTPASPGTACTPHSLLFDSRPFGMS